MSLLELVIATTMLAMVLTTVSVVVRTGRQAWEAQEADISRVEAAHATMRHIVREVRQAEAVVAISEAGDNSGHLALEMPDGTVKVWGHDANTGSVNYGIDNASDLLAPDIAALRFVGYRADGITPTDVPVEVQSLEIEVTIQLPVSIDGTRVVRSWAWVRSW